MKRDKQKHMQMLREALEREAKEESSNDSKLTNQLTNNNQFTDWKSILNNRQFWWVSFHDILFCCI